MQIYIYIRNIKQALNHGLVSKKVDRSIKVQSLKYQKALIKQNIDINTDFKKKAKNDFGKGFFKLMNNAVFGKAM